MAKVASFSVTYDRKFNIGDYNSLRLGATITVELEDDDDPDAVIAANQERVKKAVAREYVELRKKLDATKTNGQTVEAKTQIAQS